MKKQILEIAQRLYAKNCLAAADGNISCRLENNDLLLTASGRPKAFLSEDDFSIVSLDGQIKSGRPSSELAMHLFIYQNCTTAKAVVHAHPPSAIAWTMAHPDAMELPNDTLPEVLLALGKVPQLPYCIPGTTEMGTQLKSYLPEHKCFLLTRHGALCWGETLEEAWFGIERLEHTCQILALAKQLGGSPPLKKDQLDHLWKLRSQMQGRIL